MLFSFVILLNKYHEFQFYSLINFHYLYFDNNLFCILITLTFVSIFDSISKYKISDRINEYLIGL